MKLTYENVDITLQDGAEDFARPLTKPRDSSFHASQRRSNAPFVFPVFLGGDVDVRHAAVTPRHVRKRAAAAVRSVDDFALRINMVIFSRVHATLQPALFVGRSVGRLVPHTLLFFMILFL